MEPRQRDAGGWAWLGQAVSGLLLLVLLGLHMFAHHFVVEGGLRNYQDVLNYIRSPLVVVLELIFLLVVTYHAMLGLRAILFDLGLKASQERWVTRMLTVLGVVIVGYGVGLMVFLILQA